MIAKINIDHSKLRGRIKEILGSEKEYASQMGFSTFTATTKLNGKSDFKANEIIKSCHILKIPMKEIDAYFFTQKVRKP